MSGDAAVDPTELPPGRPQRELDIVSLEGLEDLVDNDAPGRALIKSRDFPELYGLEVQPADIKVVLYDANSVDSFTACFVARMALGDSARYEGVDRSTVVEELSVDVSGQVVAMLGVCWSLEAMHDLVAECDWLLIVETHVSVMRELEQFAYPSAVRILESEMGAGALAWNLFYPGAPVPPLLRALEDAELGRGALLNATAFADGFQAAFDLEPPRGELHCADSAFEEMELMLDGGGRASIIRAVEVGAALAEGIWAECQEADSRRSVRALRSFPAWRCALVNLASPLAGRVAEHLAAALAAEGGDLAEKRSFAAAFEVRRRGVRVTLRSPPGGPDVSEIARQHGGSGRPNRAFFSAPFDTWEDLWVQPEPVLWDVVAAGPRCLSLRRGELVAVARRGERFKDAPFDQWSWGCRIGDHSVEGWIPTLAHTLYVATRSAPATAPGIQVVEEGDLLVARGQRGQYFWGWNHRGGCLGGGLQGWFPYADDTWQPVHPASALDFVTASSGGA
uniref:Uncharacterized protein n=1 Tax=Pyrodinium bahamense TaxID=73915 RepID=A0A7R9ZWK3_9DINO|mmetsp:Transcript_12804/g.35426  ORF Transcript_12804/g.35426 Transcript_12804/m.35426 type:complete len:508 (+) Transcript_12804:128-1651(+)